MVALPLQLILALAFAALAYPAMILGEYSSGRPDAWHAQMHRSSATIPSPTPW
jgi:hypothetical protein